MNTTARSECEDIDPDAPQFLLTDGEYLTPCNKT